MATERYVERLGLTEGDYVVVTLEIRTRKGEGFGFQSVSHEVLHGDVIEVSLMGEAGSKYAPRSVRSAGQIVDMLSEITKPAPGWTLSEIRRVRELWERWHLNTMRAACAHMDTETLVREDNRFGGTHISTKAPENVCPVTGYQYGHAWLTEEVPAEVLDELRHLFRDRSEALYRARGYDASGKPAQS